MTLIKCPQCSQTVLSIASVCPKCGFLLMQPPPPKGEEQEFVACRRCEKVISRDAQTCQYCGYPQRFRRRLRVVGALVLGAAALAAGFIGFGLRHAETERAATESQPVTPPVVTPQPAPTAEEIVVPPPRIATGAASDTAGARPAPPATTRPTGPATTARWTVTWANVRDAPALESGIVGVLRPGSQISGVRVAGGWWAVYSGDSLVGYVASSLLADRLLPPESLGIRQE